MEQKGTVNGRCGTRVARRRLRIREDLEGLGVESRLADPLAQRLEHFGAELGTEAYAAALAGAAAACTVWNADREEAPDHVRDVDEIRQLMQGFAGELRKLEEGLRIVSAYVLRMHRKASGDRRGELH